MPYLLNSANTKPLQDELKELRCVRSLSQKTIALLASCAVKKKYKEGQIIWKAGDPGDFFAILSTGLAEITRHSATSDEESLMGIFGPSDAIGLSALLGQSTFPGNATAITKDTALIKLYIRHLIKPGASIQTETSEELGSWLRELFLAHEQVLRDKIDILHSGSVEGRAIELMLHLIRRFGDRDSHNRSKKCVIPVGLTRARLAKLINVRVETAIRLISKWKKAHLVQWNKNQIIIEDLSLLENQRKQKK